ncbi:MAG: methyltransferase domain-containing protein [Deltaproteobacteria bacterium]|nr:methyltransferase domain-containing protein [Deltaproteobacteria bacterium]
MTREQLTTAFNELKGIELENLPITRSAKLMGAICIHSHLQQVARAPDENPYPRLIACMQHVKGLLLELGNLHTLIDPPASDSGGEPNRVERLIDLYENAWTVYSLDTYEHSVKLIIDRLLANGFDANYLKGKRCFDGGCGTGRFAIAMAQLGAEVSIGLDMGERSLEFAREMAKRLKVANAEFINGDVTDLTRWPDQYFDFVVSNGVLHHTIEQHRGLREHLRVTKKGGVFWLYLYGKGGIFWEIYDWVKAWLADIPPAEIRSFLLQLGLREGAVYSVLDMLAPIRTYYSREDVTEVLAGVAKFKVSILKGVADYDSMELFLSRKYGADIFGPQGEIRLRIDRES